MNTATKHSKARAFDKSDWDLFSGAEGWVQSPMAREVGDWYVIADSKHVNAMTCLAMATPSERDVTYILAISFPNQQAARVFLDGLADDFHPDQLGMTRI